MALWTLTPHQQQTLLDFVKGDTIYELGCGDLSLARLMAQKARCVYAVDKARPSKLLADLPVNVRFVQGYFHELPWPKHIDCVVLSWPQSTHMKGLMEVIHRAFRVVYIGSNTGGCSCGEHALWRHLATRMLVHEIPDPHNCLHCYSLVTHPEIQMRSEEEVCGLLNVGLFRVFKYGALRSGELGPQQTVVQRIDEALLFSVIDGAHRFSAQEREQCLDEIMRDSEGAERSAYVTLNDPDLARAVLHAWKEFCEDKGLL